MTTGGWVAVGIACWLLSSIGLAAARRVYEMTSLKGKYQRKIEAKRAAFAAEQERRDQAARTEIGRLAPIAAMRWGSRVRATSTTVVSGYGDEIRPEHLGRQQESLIPLTDVIADTGEGDGARIAYWITHNPEAEIMLSDGWGYGETRKM